MRFRILRLTRQESALLLLAGSLVLTVRLALWLLPSRVIIRRISRLVMPNDLDGGKRTVSIGTIVWAVEAASRRIPRATCLTQAVAAQLLLRCFGFGAQFCIGVAKQPDGGFRAHAWLERHGRPILGGSGIRSFTRLPDFRADRQNPAPLGG
ncbi:MAG: lasso peptide biosynthesis B2 protein [Gemmatimonadaceae bacterium]